MWLKGCFVFCSVLKLLLCAPFGTLFIFKSVFIIIIITIHKLCPVTAVGESIKAQL